MAINFDDFFGAMNNIAKRNIDATPIDQTIDVAIAALYNIDIGEYKVTYQGDTFSAFVTDPSQVYHKGDQCYVLVPRGDFSARKIIIGYSKGSSSLEDRTDMMNYFVPKGPNWIDLYQGRKETLQLTAVLEENKHSLRHPVANWEDYAFLRTPPSTPSGEIRYPDTYLSSGELAFRDSEFQLYANTFSYIEIKANFRTEFNMVHSKGSYSILIEAFVENPNYLSPDHPSYNAAEQQYQPVTFEFGFNQFNGTPLSFPISAPQKAYYQIEKGALKGITRISFIQDGNFVSDIHPTYSKEGTLEWKIDNANLERNNIFCDNLEIRFAEKINLSDNLYHCEILAEQGNALYNRSSEGYNGKTSIDLRAKIYYGLEDITNSENCRIYWFREKVDRGYTDPLEERDEYGKTSFDYSGPGWAPIGNNLPSAIGGYETNFDILKVNIGQVDWQWNYKVVIVYNNKVIVTAEQLVIRKDSKYDLVMEEFVSEDSTQRFLRIRNQYDTFLVLKRDELTQLEADYAAETNPSQKEIIYQEILRVENEINIIIKNKDLDIPNREWFGTWWLILQDGSRRRISRPYHYGPLLINDYLLNDVATFKVQCYDPEEVDPGNNIDSPDYAESIVEVDEVGILSKVMLTTEQSDLFVEWIGKDTFTYDVSGNIKPWISEQEHTLQMRLKWAEGFGSDFLIEVLAPDGSILAGADRYSQPNREGLYGYDIKDSMMTNIWIDHLNIIHFNIRTQYDMYKTLNTFRVRITTVATGKKYELEKEIFFMKDGDQGTQGSEWIAPIKPCYWGQPGTTSEKFTSPLSYVAPLAIRPATGSETRNFVQYMGPTGTEYRVFLRPFIQKNGVPLEQMDPTEGYSYEVFWDVRYPQVSNYPNGGVLKLYSVDGVVFDGFSNPSDLGGYSPGKTAPPNTPGLQAYTKYSIDDSSNYGALEVRYDESFKPIDYSVQILTVVKAQIDIYKHGTKVASINSCHPVDLLLDGAQELTTKHFDPKKLRTNWPQFVEYNPTGYDPIVYAEYLTFKYGDTSYLPNNSLENIEPLNGTPALQDIVSGTYYDPSSIELQTGYKYRPKTYFFWQDGQNGQITTDIGAIPGFTGLSFIRTQVMRLNNYGNVDINAWDGQGIDINEDNGTLFAPTVGAGYKDPFTNTFTGVIMGIDKSQKKNDYFSDYGGFPTSDRDKNPYMTGLYGYQDGVGSFGLMENGTAFFGRADRGGRIVIDGYNAQIYGGMSTNNRPGLDADMRNRMRLSFIDFGGTQPPEPWNDPVLSPSVTNAFNAYKTASAAIDWIEYQINPTYKASVDATFKPIQNNFISTKTTVGTDRKMLNSLYDAPTKGLEVDGEDGIELGALPVDSDLNESGSAPWDKSFGNFYDFFAPGWGSDPQTNGDSQQEPGTNPYAARYGGYYTGHSYSTPAIELGSYEDWMKDSSGNRRVYSDAEKIWVRDDYPYHRGSDLIRHYTIKHIQKPEVYNKINNLEIPGFRRFLVTYDGTLYAMNAFIKGNIIGSNIVGSQFFNAEGSFVVTEDGNLGVGIEKTANKRDWEKEVVEEGYDSLWSRYIPKTNPMKVSSFLPIDYNQKKDFLDGGYAFYVSRTGTVICKDIHIAGGSLSIGDFHVIGKGSSSYNTGDVVSYGTMYLIGHKDNISQYPPNLGVPAVEAWGDFNLRGRLVNLGPVFLGGKPEKHRPNGSINPGSNMPNSSNSPVSIVPSNFNKGSYSNDPNLPVQIGIWPLYFKSSSTGSSNDTWVTLSDGAGGFMPDFSTRNNTSYGGANLESSTVWRVDKLGMWSDSIFFVRQASSTSSFSMSDAGAHIGWGKYGGTTNFRIKHDSSLASNMLIETGNKMRVSGGIGVGTGLAVLDAWSGSSRRSFLVADASPTSSLVGGANSVGFVGRDSGNTIQSFFFLNAVRFNTTELKDDLGNTICNIPSYQEGTIWVKGKSTLIDATGGVVDNADSWDATVRLNRTYSGTVGSWPGIPTGAATPGNNGTVAIGATDSIIISARDGSNAQLVVSRIPAERQFGIYARFA